MNFSLDINTVLTSAVLAGVFWILRTVIALDRKQAQGETAAKAIDEKVTDHGQRIGHVEREVGELKVEIAKVSGNGQD